MTGANGLLAGKVAVVTGAAGAAVFLASDLSSYLTGAVLEVGGGRLM